MPAALRRLMRASLLVPHPEIAERWSMLESVRELGAVELAASGDTDAAARHRRWFAARAEALGPDVGRADRPEALRELTADHDNVRHALDSAVAAGDSETGLRLCVAMGPFWLPDCTGPRASSDSGPCWPCPGTTTGSGPRASPPPASCSCSAATSPTPTPCSPRPGPARPPRATTSPRPGAVGRGADRVPGLAAGGFAAALGGVAPHAQRAGDDHAVAAPCAAARATASPRGSSPARSLRSARR